MSDSVHIKNVGPGPFPVAGKMMLPGESRWTTPKLATLVKLEHPDEVEILSGKPAKIKVEVTEEKPRKATESRSKKAAEKDQEPPEPPAPPEPPLEPEKSPAAATPPEFKGTASSPETIAQSGARSKEKGK